jgi:hypothetical protein
VESSTFCEKRVVISDRRVSMASRRVFLSPSSAAPLRLKLSSVFFRKRARVGSSDAASAVSEKAFTRS